MASVLKPRRHRSRLWIALGGVAALTAIVALAIWASDPDSAIRTTIAALLARIREPGTGLLYVLLAYAVGTLALAPITAMFVATALAVGPVLGFFYALLGGLFGATLAYLVGRKLGSGPLARVHHPRLTQLRHQARSHSIRAVVIARFLPVGNFTLINVFLGGLKVPYLAFFVGNVVGIVPGLLALTLLADQLEQAFKDPSPASVGRLALIAVVAVALLWGGSRFLARRKARREREEGDAAGVLEEKGPSSP